jgi:transcription-repair coupling factor (superfamily II helicase)
MEEPTEVDALGAEVMDRFGALPREASNLLELTRLKLQAIALGIAVIQFKPDRIVVEWLPGRSLMAATCAFIVETFEGRVLFKSGVAFGLTITRGGEAYLLDDAKKLLNIALRYEKMDNSPDREH